ncbi:MAG: transporter [Pseudomonadota bacterium]|nr:transporter [Pseudomonadota bacterium]
MSKRVAILTPDPQDEGFHTRWRDIFAREAALLEAAGFAVEGPSWVDPIDAAAYDLVMPLLTWGYHRAGEAWLQAVDGWEWQGLRIANPPSVLRWNVDKAYLWTLTERGAPVVPTLYFDSVSEEVLLAAAEHFGTSRVIAKPRVSASAWQTIRWSAGHPLEGGPSDAAMIQPYLPLIETQGELSLLYFDGAFSHAIRKRPQPGDFRVQPEYDGIITPHEPLPDELETAEAILAAVEEPLLYARIDLVRGLDGSPLLMELELVEPDLYVEFDAAAGRGFLEAVKRAVTSAPLAV